MTLPLESVIETIVLLKVAAILAIPELMFFEPLALRTLMEASSSLRRASAVAAFGTPPTSSTGLAASAAGAAAGASPSAGLAAFGALAGFASAAGAAPSAAATT